MSDQRITAVLLALTTALAVSGCGSTIGGTMPEWAGGEPAVTPARAANLPAYPTVGDTPPSRDVKLISQTDQSKLEADLTAARNAQAAQAEAIAKDRDAEMATQKALETHTKDTAKTSGSN